MKPVLVIDLGIDAPTNVLQEARNEAVGEAIVDDYHVLVVAIGKEGSVYVVSNNENQETK